MAIVDTGFILIDQIDERQTISNGRNICRQYKPLLEKRRRQILATPMRTGSFIKATNDIKSGNNTERMLLERCEWESDQVAMFIQNVTKIKDVDLKAGLYLQYKYIEDLTDEEILKKMKISVDRTLRRYKSTAYYMVAIWSGLEEFVHSETFDFTYNL